MHSRQIFSSLSDGLNARLRPIDARLARLTTIFAAILCAMTLAAGPSPAGAQTVTLARNHPEATAILTGRAATDQPLTINVNFALRDQARLQALIASQQNPKSAKFHKWLTPAEFNSRFGRTRGEVNAVRQWLEDQGFQITAASSRGITATGSAAMAEAAFDTTIAASPDGTVFANLTDPAIPSRFASIIGSIDGLDNTRHAIPLVNRTPNAASALAAPAPLLASALALDGITGGDTSPDYSGSSGTAFGPADFYTFYDETPLLNAGTNGSGSDCIAVIEDSNYLASAVTLFDTTFALPTASITNVFPDSTAPSTNGDEIEVLLDLEWAHAVAPDAPLRAYMGSGSNALPDAIKRAVSDNACSSISISYAFCGGANSFYTVTLDSDFLEAASQGQSVFVSAGDEGSAGLASNCTVGTTQNVSEMSADPNVTAAGGTQFVPTYSSSNDAGSVAESVWSDPAGATGGGKSKLFTKPPFQTANTPADGQRDVPDIAFGSSPYYPGFYYAEDVDSNPVLTCCIGGTSIAAPMWAGLVRLIRQGSGREGNIDTRLYQMGPSGTTDGLRDVTQANDANNNSSGNNSWNGVPGFSATPGYDQATGWGSADATNFVNAFPVSSTSPTPTPTPTPSPTPSPTATPSPTPTPAPTPTATASAEPTPSSSPTATASPTASATPSPAPSPSPSPSSTPTPGLKASAPTISPNVLNFGEVREGTTSPSHNLTITNPSTSPASLVISGVTVSSHYSIFSGSTTCTSGKSVAPGSSCGIAIRFTPAGVGNESGTLSISDNASNSPQTVTLTGYGVN